MTKFRTAIILLLIASITQAQELTQTIRGSVFDKESEITLPGASVIVLGATPLLGTVTDGEGVFKITGVPVGRYDIQVSFIGYESFTLREILVGSAKEIVLNAGLKESITKLDEVVVKAYTRKDQPINNMAVISARSFSVEETSRYAGGLDDPARMVAGYAGVSASPDFGDNQIVIRGNSPKGLLWRLEGVDIPNPNHFGSVGGSGGGVSILSSQLVSNSDFFTGAFPAEYGNAMAGVFDIKLRNGNNEKYEHAFKAGFLGLEFASEGPFTKGKKSSYLFNYRYSTLGLVGAALYSDEVGGVNEFPNYQDLSFKLNMPTKKAGVFTITGISGIGIITNKMLQDSTEWNDDNDKVEEDWDVKMGALVFSHKYIANNKTYFKNSIVLSRISSEQGFNLLTPDVETGYYSANVMDESGKIAYNAILNHKFSARHTNRTGFNYNYLYYDTDLKAVTEKDGVEKQIAKSSGNTNLIQAYTQSKYYFTDKFLVNAGVYFQALSLNKNYSIEPRIAFKWNFSDRHAVNFGYGKHSQMEHIGIYLADVNSAKPNKDLEFSKAHHFVIGYDFLITEKLRLKIEPYYQLLYDVPVEDNTDFSMINNVGDFVDKALINTGEGYNYGIDVTLERFFKNNFYYLFTASIYDSKYKGGDNIERDTRFNNNFSLNGVFGKEYFREKEGKVKIFGINGRVYFAGGRRFTPLNEQASLNAQTSIYYNNRPFENQFDNFLGLDLNFTYRINKKNHSSVWGLQIKNALGSDPGSRPYYDSVTGKIEEEVGVGMLPFLNYKIEF